ncbi:MAG: transcription-repair coupling factor [Firmicutes bacterium]|nr:transcription-repair coupling factor [Bacillota bacterium]
MPLRGIVRTLRDHEGFASLISGLEEGWNLQSITGVSGSSRSLVPAAIRELTKRPVFVVTSNIVEAERFVEECESWLGAGEACLFPPLEALPFEIVARSGEMEAGRVSVLERLATGGRPIIVAPITALHRLVVPPGVIRDACLTVRAGDEAGLETISAALARAGYERLNIVEGRGQYAVRGGIVDVFPPSRESPVRLEFFGDELQSIREFDPISQKSSHAITSLIIGPAREFLVGEDRIGEGLARIRAELESSVKKLEAAGHRSSANRLKTKVRFHLECISEARFFEGVENYLPYFYPETASLLDHVPRDSVVILDDYPRLRESSEQTEKDARDAYSSRLSQGALLPAEALAYESFERVMERVFSFQVVHLSVLPRLIEGRDARNLAQFGARPAPSFHGQWNSLIQELKGRKTAGAAVACVVANADRVRALSATLKVEGVEVVTAESLDREPREGQVIVTTGAVSEGMEIPALRLTVLGDGEIYGKTKRKRTSAQPRERLTGIFEDLKVGDYVVHVNHGIGRYLGVKTLEIEGAQKDYFFIKYAGADALYVPTDQSDLIHKYIGGEGQEPRLNKLGGTEWSRVKNRVRESVRELARDLLHLYAIRQASKGFQFSPDTSWQREFEDAFKYEETPDQRQATEEIKGDMEGPRAMDRLLVGDVGYGKTEVAMRAAFKAVNDSKQVAVLVPTTILAQQHFNTFRERFEDYPIRVEVLSRFRSPKEQDQVVKDLRLGTVDIVIGTHRLLQDDIAFNNLGLLVVDEEHRFGVAHKEKIKRLKQTVDVLTLTATPIPRTLHMALTGFRDMSVIETPPEDRFPVQTFVVEQSDDLVRAAVARELHRGGQVYYVHNRVQTIERVASRLRALVPDARIAVAHGQIREDRLEKTMLAFLDGEYDILLCTTIIESGLDIANVNTLIVEDADHLGLAQLYQLRGRVGRSNRLAYAYFMYRRDKVLQEQAEKRLEAIREFTEFGSGFKIAMRDLEIRGAGNILGAEQHGFIASVGFDMYCRLLEQAVRELKGEELREPPAVSIEVLADAYLPDSYVPDSRQKVDLYKKIAAIRETGDAEVVAEEMKDRFGPIPPPAANLLTVARVKILAARAGITAISQGKDRIEFRIGNPGLFPADRAHALVRQYRGRMMMPGRGLISMKVDGAGRTALLLATESFLEALAPVASGADQ